MSVAPHRAPSWRDRTPWPIRVPSFSPTTDWLLRLLPATSTTPPTAVVPGLISDTKVLQGSIGEARRKLDDADRAISATDLPPDVRRGGRFASALANIELLDHRLRDAVLAAADAQRSTAGALAWSDRLMGSCSTEPGVEHGPDGRLVDALREYLRCETRELTLVREAVATAEALLHSKRAVVERHTAPGSTEPSVLVFVVICVALLAVACGLAPSAYPGLAQMEGQAAAAAEKARAAHAAAARARAARAAVKKATAGRDDMLCTYRADMAAPACLPASEHQAGLGDPAAVVAEMLATVNHVHFFPYADAAKITRRPLPKSMMLASPERLERNLDGGLQILGRFLSNHRGTETYHVLNGVRAALHWKFRPHVPGLLAAASDLRDGDRVLWRVLYDARNSLEGADDVSVAKLFVESSAIRVALSRLQARYHAAVQAYRAAWADFPADALPQLHAAQKASASGSLQNSTPQADRDIAWALDLITELHHLLEVDQAWLDNGVVWHERAAAIWESRRGKDWWYGDEVLRTISHAHA